jgi:hypothetical protein
VTRAEYDKEWNYILDERRGILCGAGPVPAEAELIAQREASDHMDALEREEKENQAQLAAIKASNHEN